jgi:hypothetical protein
MVVLFLGCQPFLDLIAAVAAAAAVVKSGQEFLKLLIDVLGALLEEEVNALFVVFLYELAFLLLFGQSFRFGAAAAAAAAAAPTPPRLRVRG